MMTAPKGMILTDRQMCIETKFYECINSKLGANATAMEAKMENFLLPKQRGFSFDINAFNEKGLLKGDNCGNYQLEKITLSDFEKIEKEVFILDLHDYFNKIILKYTSEINNQNNAYNKTVLSVCDLFIDFSEKILKI